MSETARATRSELEAGFITPPNAARPRVWWHWMNGNIAKEGIKLDLEWMNRVGIGGFQMFDAGWNTPQVVPERLTYMTAPWKDALKYAVDLGREFGFEMAIAGSPGWSETGGPWVSPDQAMKKLVWSETIVRGGDAAPALPPPHDVAGTFQNFPNAGHVGSLGTQGPKPLDPFYRDARVVAFPLPACEHDALPAPAVTSSAGAVDPAILSDNDYVSAVDLPIVPGEPHATIQFDFGSAQTIRSLSVAVAPDNWAKPKVRRQAPPLGTLEASDDGVTFHPVAEVPGYELGRSSAPQHTLSIAPTTARFFRVNFTNPPEALDFRASPFRFSERPKAHRVSQLVLRGGARINRFEEKAGFGTLNDFYIHPGHPAEANAIVKSADVIDLTDRFNAETAALDWTAPDGQWVVLRVGYSLVGTKNHPASPEATGLEVDKLNRTHVKAYLDTYLAQYADASGAPLGKHGIAAMITDSWEAGTQNWTEDMPALFAAERGYPLLPFMPALFGYVVDGVAESEGFLWDFRRAIGDLVVKNHYGEIADTLHAHGMLHYCESMERERPTIGDGMAFKERSDVPMGAFWVRREHGEDIPNYGVDLQETASVAHLYGQNLVAAEAMTTNGDLSGWSDSPRSLKPVADEMMALGVNRFVIHTSVHQPLADAAPGLTLGPYGQHFNRNDTWAEPAGQAWVSYLTRCSHLLQAGRFAADIAYFYGQEAPITGLYAHDKFMDMPEGYAFDFVNDNALLDLFSVEDGRLTTPSCMRYRVLYLGGNSVALTLPVLKKLKTLITAGATVIGERPRFTPSQADDREAFAALVSELWGDHETRGLRGIGRGRLYQGRRLPQALAALGLHPDFDYTRVDPAHKLLFVHRQTPDLDIYFVNSRVATDAAFDLSLRVGRGSAEIWHPETGRITPVHARTEGDRTVVPLTLRPRETVFVVLSNGGARTAPASAPTLRTLFELAGEWNLRFQPKRGAPAEATFAHLEAWNESTDAGIRHFSGTATYAKRFALPQGARQHGERLILDLGSVREIAAVRLNGKPVGLCWAEPYEVDITDHVRGGDNDLEVDVTNLWVNRMIGDEIAKETGETISFTVFPVYRKDSPLLPSGLLGPVRIKVLSSR
ncbi:MAG: hypothetical protein KF735_12680 [Chelatococcus sp.]|uniref:glycosyl hydrolase n=1 Tax=Chelatococcus sp. TaxID=1953771 RepID=UPI0025BEE68B|nr:glycosyl hydrolase [Chelatococcus sp.]MBX3538493.1 hypothetical protein [Chelatococcus sp.]